MWLIWSLHDELVRPFCFVEKGKKGNNYLSVLGEWGWKKGEKLILKWNSPNKEKKNTYWYERRDKVKWTTLLYRNS